SSSNFDGTVILCARCDNDSIDTLPFGNLGSSLDQGRWRCDIVGTQLEGEITFGRIRVGPQHPTARSLQHLNRQLSDKPQSNYRDTITKPRIRLPNPL